MKKALVISFTVIILVLGFLIFLPDNNKNEAYLRIHIRANSNSKADQEVKYEIKNAIVDYLTPLVENAKDLAEAESIINSNLQSISTLASRVLQDNGFDYSAKAKLKNEYFPTRNYNELVLDSGYYDALILELGEAEGDNWWCVVYPPICFLSSGGGSVSYKSIIADLINKK